MKSLTLFFRLIVLVLVGTSLTTESAAQCISGNCQNGTGTYRYSGSAKYTGQFKNGQRNGKGKMTLANSNVYEGQFVNNRMQGEGTMNYPNGDRYIGQWSSDMPNGKGKYLFVTKERYEGNFVNGEFDGQGTMTYPDGAYYTGSWKRNKKSGAGKMYDADGGVISGTWANGKLINKQDKPQANNNSTANNSQPGRNKPNQGKPANTSKPDVAGLRNCSNTYCRNGQGFYDYPDGSRWVGAFKEGYPAGRGICYYSNGDRYEGEWANNAPYGEGIMYFTSGRVYGAVWVNGSPVKELDADERMPTDPVKMEASQSVRIWAVIVGVSKYTAMPSLKYTDDDAWKFYSHLISPEGGAVPENQISVLTDETATRESILRAMREKFLKADANDVVMLFYSGHGLEGCFLPFDYDGYNNKLRHEDVKQVFKQSKAKHKICIADACHSGSLNYSGSLVAKGPSPVSLQRYYQAFEESDGGIALLMSSKSEELSLEDQGLRHGVFTYYILQGLRGQADRNNDYLVTVRELYGYVYNKVRDYTAGAQTPVLTGDFDDAMPVALRRY